MATMNISLPQQMKDWIEAQVATGRYANASDMVRDLVRREHDRSAALRELERLVAEADASGPPAPLDLDGIWQKATARYEATHGKLPE